MHATTRGRLRAMALGLLGSAPEAERAVRTTERALASYGPGPRARRGPGPVPDPGPPPEAVLARICLGRLRAREARRTDPWDPWADAPDVPGLTPAERLVLVLHDLHGVPYETLATVLERAPAAVRQIGARARARARGAEEMPAPDPVRLRAAVDAVLTAAREGDTAALRALLDPDAVLRADRGAARGGVRPAHGAPAVARVLAPRAAAARPVLVDGAPALVAAPDAVYVFTAPAGPITSIDVLADPPHVSRHAITT
ncbi:sigma factor-like helix-turn-helix DNA-binding protein [Streptomyces roseolus]|uniref:sigma factor-like helix-turn-helix DNA-binding protein n=1 Tax=Streptomyces roseolus TaxID=67358 RepID=UPI0019A765B9|nr:sigma factor-like helix-turn-helix DNA-binding protein [Streptomyces roseolus]GGR12466.1 DNA-directed RNA polymerase sigma-70 factor [Streptomyces roseolus]